MDVSLPANATGTFQVVFTISSGMNSGTINNTVLCSDVLQNCSPLIEEGVITSSYIIPDTTLSTPSVYDLEINKYHGDCVSG